LVVLAALAGCGDDTSDAPTRAREIKLGTPDTTVPRNPTKSPPEERATNRPGRPKIGRSSRPPIEPWPIPFSAARHRETADYTQRHYGSGTTRLTPKVIVEHYSETSTAQAVFNTFARDVPDVELHELPGVCSHFLVDRDGTIFQLVPLTLICRHTVGLNDVAVGIEHVGSSDADVLNNAKQLRASLRLTAWLRCRFRISIGNVIGHAESLSSPYHHEKVPALRSQTHSDFQPAAMGRFRDQLRQRPC